MTAVDKITAQEVRFTVCVEDLIPHILKLAEMALRLSRITKLMYLVDLAWVQLTSRTLTGSSYVWRESGLHCEQIDKAMCSLGNRGAVRERRVPHEGRDITLYELRCSESLSELGEWEAKLIDYVALRYFPMPDDDLTRFVQVTAPVARVTQDNRDETIEMTIYDELSADELKSLIDQSLAAQDGRRHCTHEVLNLL